MNNYMQGMCSNLRTIEHCWAASMEPLTGQVLLLQLLEALVLCLSHLALLLGLIVARPSNRCRLLSLPAGVDNV